MSQVTCVWYYALHLHDIAAKLSTLSMLNSINMGLQNKAALCNQWSVDEQVIRTCDVYVQYSEKMYMYMQ